MTLTPLAKRLAVESCHSLFLRLRSVASGIRTPNLSLADDLALLSQSHSQMQDKTSTLEPLFYRMVVKLYHNC